ncbi:hypothetical protein B0T14DRAFT_563651 [Immersiella caudata]|uniref:Uncharacterized protein n=1 Tax=Immersiella caudata TaxID=314043 RepID=A0AA39X6U0_9PEZI|nr:hypothetical protein B0T14DRAFT_563651 [Immersiella caudata]
MTGKRPLADACSDGNLEIAELLLVHGAAVKTDKGSPMCLAAGVGDVPVIEALLQHGASARDKDAQGWFESHPYADDVPKEDCNVIKELLKEPAKREWNDLRVEFLQNSTSGKTPQSDLVELPEDDRSVNSATRPLPT